MALDVVTTGAAIPLVAFDELADGAGRRIRAGGLDIALFRIGADVYAIDDSCPHRGACLSVGRVENGRVRCPAHGLWFDLRGETSGGPATLPVHRYQVEVVDGVVMLRAGASGVASPISLSGGT
ncbi:MAG: Rieske 2Fe-2S domain-containing protein [Hyphomicrobiales bacterium]|nr:Rieske 2Fe-2S domain-containing protein [Hyphomicrobiales bacterium]